MANETVAHDFTDNRLFVVGMNESMRPFFQRDYLGFSQSFDGPRYIIVGPDVSDEKMQRNLPNLSSCCNVTLTLPQLQAVRDQQAEAREAQAA